MSLFVSQLGGRHRRGHVQAKSLDINRVQPHLLAVAGSDPYIRLYDRRMLSVSTHRPGGSTPVLLALAPPHAALPGAGRHGRAHCTYVSFGNRGDKVSR